MDLLFIEPILEKDRVHRLSTHLLWRKWMVVGYENGWFSEAKVNYKIHISIPEFFLESLELDVRS